MEKIITIKSEHNSLDKLYEVLKRDSNYEYSIEYDIWDHRIDAKGQMEQCIVIKKSSMHAIKVFFIEENTVNIKYIIPSKLMNSYFGKSVKARRSIIDIIAELIKETILAPFQEKAFEELEQAFYKITA